MRPGATPYDTLAALLDLHTVDRAPAAGDEWRRRLVRTRPQPSRRRAGRACCWWSTSTRSCSPRPTADQRSHFEQALLQLQAAPDFYLIIAARADFYANLMASPLWEQIREHRLEVTPPRGDALREAIALPARDVGVQLEPQLVERLLADAGEEPGVLPFIQETLVMLWAHAARLRHRSRRLHRPGGRQERALGPAGGAGRACRARLSALCWQTTPSAPWPSAFCCGCIQFGEGRPDTRRQQTVDELRTGDGAQPAGL